MFFYQTAPVSEVSAAVFAPDQRSCAKDTCSQILSEVLSLGTRHGVF